MKNIAFGFLLIMSGSIIARAAVKLPRLISDGMIIQREVAVRVWGWANPGEAVKVEFNNQQYNTVAGKDSTWEVKLAPVKAGGPFTMTITGENKIQVRDILAGDVWVCSGQSNMALQVSKIREQYKTLIDGASNPAIRQFLPERRYSLDEPLKDVVCEGWKPVTPRNVMDFTAVGYFFAAELYQRYKVPIGLINNSWGGTPAEAWISEEALKQFPHYAQEEADMKDPVKVAAMVKANQDALDAWHDTLRRNDAGAGRAGRSWADQLLDDAQWKNVIMPDYWDAQGLKYVHGVVWFRKHVTIPASMVGKEAVLYLGNIVDQDTTYVNGIKVGFTDDKNKNRRYTIPATLLKEGENIITVRILNSAGQGGMIGSKTYKITAGREAIDLAGEWKASVGANSKVAPRGTLFQYEPGTLYKGMLYPLLPYAIKGVIWYQGEANAGKAREYQSLFKTLITDWRGKWGQGDFPFLYVQLANFMKPVDQPAESNWAQLREAQTMALSLPNTGMAVIHDIGEAGDIHPRNKYDVGKRLALAAEKIAYGENEIIYSGPVMRSAKREGNKVIITFAHTGGGLTAKGSEAVKYFALAGPDKKFVWANAVIKGDRVEVWSEAITRPVAVSYAWADNPEGANLYNKEGLPATSFRYEFP